MAPVNDGVIKHQAWLGQLLNNDRNAADSTCDLMLESEGKQFKVHKSVLMLVSNFFRRMFTIEMKEKYEGIVKMQKIPHQRLANILQFIYSGEIKITQENMLDILDDAEYTEIKVLKAKCSAFLLNVVSADNCLKLRAYAQRYNLDDLLNKANKSIANNFEDVVLHEDFRQLSASDISSILENRSKNCEQAVFSGIVQWVRYNPLQREELFVNLFSQLHLTSMSVNFLDEVYNEVLVKNNLVCINLLAQASLKMNKRIPAESTKFLVISGHDSEQDCVVYDVKSKQAKKLPKLNVGRCGATAVKSENKVFVIGGAETHIGTNPLKVCEMLHLNHQPRWVLLSDMLMARDDCRSGLIQEQIFVTGGYNNGTYLSSCEKFDICSNKWTMIGDMLDARASHGTVVINDLLYCIGGANDGKLVDSCECLDVRFGKWKKIAPLKQSRWGFACVALDGEIFAIGGCSGSNQTTVEKYKPKMNRWETVASLDIPRRRLSACVIGNQIFAIGGGSSHLSKLNSVTVYDPAVDEWTDAFETETDVYGATVVAI